MDKKIGVYMSIMVSIFMSNIFAMDRNGTLVELMYKNHIPTLALNDYLVPVPSAYQALQKEASLWHSSSKTALSLYVKQLNKHMREQVIRDDLYPYKVRGVKVYNEVARRTGYRTIDIVCKSSSTRTDRMNINIKKQIFGFTVLHGKLKACLCMQDRETIKNVDEFLKTIIDQCLPKGRKKYIELAASYKVSDWVSIENRFGPAQHLVSMELLADNSAPFLEGAIVASACFLDVEDIDLIIKDMHDLEMLSHIIMGGVTILIGTALGLSLCY